MFWGQLLFMQALLEQASCLVVVRTNLAQPKRTSVPCALQGGTNAGLRAWGVGEIVSFGKVKQVQIAVHACPKQFITPSFAAVRSGRTTDAVFVYACPNSSSHHYLLLSDQEARQLLLFLCMLTGSAAVMFCDPCCFTCCTKLTTRMTALAAF